MAISLSSAALQRAEINMTPMIDVLLVLIIIFMIITPLTPTGLDTLIPQLPRAPQQLAPLHDIVITVKGDRTLRLNEEPIDLPKLHERLSLVFRSRANRVVFVRGEKNLEFRQVAEVIDIAKGAGVDRVGLMTQ